MSKSERPATPPGTAVALQYDGKDSAPVIVASGLGYLAEKIVEVAAANGVPVYEDNSLSTVLSKLQLGQEIPPSLYGAIVDIYLYFLEFDPSNPEGLSRLRREDSSEQPSPPESGGKETPHVAL